MVERDFDVFIQVFDWSAGIGHTGWHHKGVEGLTLLAALKITTKCMWVIYLTNVHLISLFSGDSKHDGVYNEVCLKCDTK